MGGLCVLANTGQKLPKKLNIPIYEVTCIPFTGTGKPEALKHELAGCRSRRVTDKLRLVYRMKVEGWGLHRAGFIIGGGKKRGSTH